MIDEQVGNASQEAPENNAGDDFFSELESQVNGGIIDNEGSSKKATQQKAAPVKKEPSADIENLQKRYSDSSKEAKRLNSQLQELEPYMPILNAMKEDPQLISHVKDYFEGGGQAPKSMKEQLGLDEDFVYDADEAFRQPDSDSGKLFQASVDGLVQRRLNKALQTQRAETEKQSKENAFRQKHNMTEEEWSDFVEYAKSKSLSFEDIYYLKNKGAREQNIASRASADVTKQMQQAQQKPPSLASAGNVVGDDVSQEDKLFDAILGIDKQLDNGFG